MVLKQQLLQYEIILSVKQMSTATTGLFMRMLEVSAVGSKATLRLKAMLINYVFYILKPP